MRRLPRNAAPGHRHRLSPLKMSIMLALLPFSAQAADGLFDLGLINSGSSSEASVSSWLAK